MAGRNAGSDGSDVCMFSEEWGEGGTSWRGGRMKNGRTK